MESDNQLSIKPLIYELAKAYKQWKCVQTGCVQTGCNLSLRVIESIATIEKTAIFCNDCEKQLTEIKTEI